MKNKGERHDNPQTSEKVMEWAGKQRVQSDADKKSLGKKCIRAEGRGWFHELSVKYSVLPNVLTFLVSLC